MKSYEKMQTNPQWQKADHWVPGDGGRAEEGKGGWIAKRQEKFLESDGYVHNVNCGDDFMSVNIVKTY